MIQNYRWTMKIASTFSELLIPNILRQKVPLVNLVLRKKGLPWLELSSRSECFAGNLLFFAWWGQLYFSLPH